MSRSKRKTPIFGIASAKSEKLDKHIWHSRMRTRVRTEIGSKPVARLDAYIAPVDNDVGNVWAMSKDGKHYFRRDRQVAVATLLARRGKTPIERQALKIRHLKKLQAK